MKIIIILLVMMFLISCGGGDNTNNTGNTELECSRSKWYADNPNVPNSIKFQILKNDSCTRMEGVVVQLDNNGKVLLTDKSGIIKFTNLTGLHDIHVFSPTDYGWHSFYNINTDTGYNNLLNLPNFNDGGTYVV